MKSATGSSADYVITPLGVQVLFVLAFFFLGSGNIRSQTADSISVQPVAGQIQLAYKYYGDSTVLRWGFDHPQLWYHHLYHPVTLWRRDVTNDGPYQKIGTFMPWDSTQMEQTASASAVPDMLAVVLENIHRHWDNTVFVDYSTILERNDNFFNRWSLVHFAADRDAVAATAAGLRYVDRDLKPNITYAYKVVTDGETSQAYKVAFPVKKNFQPVLFEVEEGDSTVILQWEKKLHDYHFSAYWIEQSPDGKKYTRINDAPYVQMMDEKLDGRQRFYTYAVQTENYRKKHYRIVGLDAFGDESAPSDPVVATGRDKTAPEAPVVWADTSQRHHSKLLYWSHPNPADVRVFHLERSFANQTIILENFASGSATSGKDSVTVEGVYKYRLIAVDTAGNQSFSVPVYTKVYDLLPPAAPRKPQALTDTTGIIMLTWDEHQETDIIGYNVYAADGEGRNFVKLNQHIYRSRIYMDTIDVHMLNEKRYYRIAAVDNDYMISDPSETLIVDRPDVIPPAPALIGDYRVVQEGIRLTLLPSSSRDVVRHELRRKEGQGEWVTIMKFDKMQPSFLDSSVKPETDYEYRVIAIDQSGLESHSVKDIMLTSMPARIITPEITYTLDGENVQVKILPVQATSGNKYMVYRAEGDGKITRHAEMNEQMYAETLKQGIVYRYRVRPLMEDGRPGPFSNEIMVQIPTR